MTDIMEYVRNRRSERKYDSTAVSRDKLDLILEAGLRSPTGNNFRETEFIVVEDRDVLGYLSGLRRFATRMLETAGAAIIVIADEEKSNLWIEDASIAMAYMHLAASALGLGSCWVQMRTRADDNGDDLGDVLREKFSIPDNMGVLAILAVGNMGENKKKPARGNPDWDRVHFGEF